MPWPSLQDYNEAIQNPAQVFIDPELKTGQVETDRMGLPKPRAGNFATVYRIHCGGRSFAVRCFSHELRDQHERYSAISSHLSQSRLPYTVSFSFLPQGIKIRGGWFPILKMEWVQGESLTSYVEKQSKNPAALKDLAKRWVSMVQTLQRSSIAHGDLQHGNVLVSQGELKLVDYDGMFVPALAGRTSLELGHVNYQHPSRCDYDYGASLDNFSAWVVYLSLMAIAIEPALWRRANGGDDCLLLRKKDFSDPDTSAILKYMENSPVLEIRALTTVLKSFLQLPAAYIPALDPGAVPTDAPRPAVATAPVVGPDWMSDWKDQASVGRSFAGIPEKVVTGSPPIDASWLSDVLSPDFGKFTEAKFSNAKASERIAVFTSLAGAALGVAGVFNGVLIPTTVLPVIAIAILASILLLVGRYRKDKIHEERRELIRQQSAVQEQIRQAKRLLQDETLERETVLRSAEIDKANVLKKLEAVRGEENRELVVANTTMQERMFEVQAELKSLQEKQSGDLKKIDADVGTRLRSNTSILGDLGSLENVEIRGALSEIQNQHFKARLSGASVDDAKILGFGQGLKNKLKSYGIYNALDARRSSLNLPGIGDGRRYAIQAWYEGIEAHARATMPKELSPAAMSAIRARYATRHSQLTTESQQLHARMLAEQARTKSSYQGRIEAAERNMAGARNDAAATIERIRNKYKPKYPPIIEAGDKAAMGAKAKLSEIEARLAKTKNEDFGLHMQKAKLERQLASYKNVGFGRYVGRLFAFWS